MSVARRRYALALWVLLGLFVLRVLAQLSIALGADGCLPPWEEWFSGALAYPPLLASQIVIILFYGKIALDVSRGRGFFAAPHPALGSALLACGSVYLAVMVIRYAIRMTLYPPERWTGGSIPIVFHWVLAVFLLVVAAYHLRAAPSGRSSETSVRARVAQTVGWLVVATGIAAWIWYQAAPAWLKDPTP